MMNISSTYLLNELTKKLNHNIKIENIMQKNEELKNKNRDLIIENQILIKLLNSVQLETINEKRLAEIVTRKVYKGL